MHKTLGSGLLESVYQSAMTVELEFMGLSVLSDVALPVFYKGKKIHSEGFRLDLLVQDTVIVELKSVSKLENIHKKQLLTYLRLAQKPLGLMIHPWPFVLRTV